MIASFVVFVSFLLICAHCGSGASINPERLVITTVLDPCSMAVVRDVFTMLRSIRLFGGTLNLATLMVIVILDDNLPVELDNFIYDLTSLKAEIVYSWFDSSSNHYPRTLNKFLAMKYYDALRFDYFLWLDGDTLIVGDPVEKFSSHPFPGHVNCVPELYNYMQRYPQFNSTNMVWDKSLPSMILLGAGEHATHGVCNTGVLLFDSNSLFKFMAAYPHVLESFTIDNAKSAIKDRFLDSLVFVGVLNQQHIEAVPWANPYQFNYMALFEVEIMEETVIEDLFIAHFLSDTEFYCEMSTSDSCSCKYITSLAPSENSLLLKKLDLMRPQGVCRVLAGVDPPDAGHWALPQADHPVVSKHQFFARPALPAASSENGVSGQDARVGAEGGVDVAESGGGGGGGEWLCELGWPPVTGSVVQIQAFDDTISLPITVHCAWSLDSVDQELRVHSDVDAEEEEEEVVDLHVCVFLNSSSASGSPTKWSNATGWWLGHDSTRQKATTPRAHTLLFEDTAPLKLPACSQSAHCLYDVVAVMKFRLCKTVEQADGTVMNYCPSFTHPKYLLDIEFSLSRGQGREHSSAVIVRAQLLITVTSLSQPAALQYNMSPLSGLHSVSLASQLLLPSFLDDRSLNAYMGVAVCCDSHKGLQTVMNIIQHWRGPALLLLLVNHPATLSDDDDDHPLHTQHTQTRQHGVRRMADQLQTLCRASGGVSKCVMQVNPARETDTDAVTLTARALSSSQPLSFVFLDSYSHSSEKTSNLVYHEDYSHYLHWLLLWHRRLQRGGVLLGTGYTLSGRGSLVTVSDSDGPSHTQRVGLSVTASTKEALLSSSSSSSERVFVSEAVLALSERTHTSPLVTYLEHVQLLCRQCGGGSVAACSLECSPSYYFFKP